METISREQFQQRLQDDWQALPVRFQGLPPAEQAAYLEIQGYATLGGLLSHILAWWLDGEQAVAAFRINPALPLQEYDVDSFNAQAVARFAPLGEEEILRRYQTQRQGMFDLVNSLSEEELHGEHIHRRLYYEIIMHWKEHLLESAKE